MYGNFSQATLHSCFFKNLFIVEIHGPELLKINAIEEGCIFDAVAMGPDDEKNLLGRAAMINAKIDPEFAAYYQNPKIHDNFGEVVTKEFILSVARQAGVKALSGFALYSSNNSIVLIVCQANGPHKNVRIVYDPD